jgi:hypothetical protein
VKKNGLAVIRSALARCWTNVARAASMSRSVLAPRTTSCSPTARAAACVLVVRDFGPRHVWVHEHSDNGRLRDQLAQQSELLRPLRTLLTGYAGCLTAAFDGEGAASGP